MNTPSMFSPLKPNFSQDSWFFSSLKTHKIKQGFLSPLVQDFFLWRTLSKAYQSFSQSLCFYISLFFSIVVNNCMELRKKQQIVSELGLRLCQEISQMSNEGGPVMVKIPWTLGVSLPFMLTREKNPQMSRWKLWSFVHSIVMLPPQWRERWR